MRAAGFHIAPEQTIGFLEAVKLLGPRSMHDIQRAARAMLAPPWDRMKEFDKLFHQWFWGNTEIAAVNEGDDETQVNDDSGAIEKRPPAIGEETSGEFASRMEQLGHRNFASDDVPLNHFARLLSSALPTRRSLRHTRARHGIPDLRKSLRAIVAADGDIPSPAFRRRLIVPVKLMLLIDISGSMKQHTEDHLKIAHSVIQVASRAEVFTLGTRLTRITLPLRVQSRNLSLERVTELVDDWDGGTRIGPTLLALLAVPRFAAFARGAAIILLSDGLERGSHVEMEAAFRRLSARAHRLSLCTPLAHDPRFLPRTAALKAILPFLDDLVDGSSLGHIARFILDLATPAPSADKVWRKAS